MRRSTARLWVMVVQMFEQLKSGFMRDSNGFWTSTILVIIWIYSWRTWGNCSSLWAPSFPWHPTRLWQLPQMLSIVSGIANYFGKSNYGTFHLDEQRKKEGVAEGIKSCSKTRFSSSYMQVLSVQTCMNVIKNCVQTGTLKFDTAAVSTFSRTPKNLNKLTISHSI